MGKKSKVNPKYKKQRKVRNWKEYEASLVQRGSLTLWMSEEAIAQWLAPKTGSPGRPRLYSDLAMEMILTLQYVYRLAQRQVIGFVSSLFSLMGLDLPVPDKSRLSRRAKDIHLSFNHLPKGPIVLIVDATGLKLFGQGEWARTKHGISGRRRWKKLHIGVDASGFVHAALLTDDSVGDPTAVPELLDQVDEDMEGFVGDGAYDGRPTREAAHAKGANILVPPPRNAVPWDEVDKVARERNQELEKIKTMGRRAWEKESGYRIQGRAENTFYRYKRRFGGTLNARTKITQKLEVRLKLVLLNRMFNLGKPNYLLSNPS